MQGPEAAAAVVNAVTSSYLEQGRKDEHAVIDQRLKLLGEEPAKDSAGVGRGPGGNRLRWVGRWGWRILRARRRRRSTRRLPGYRRRWPGAREARDVAAAQYAAVAGGSSPALAAAADEQIATDAGVEQYEADRSARGRRC